MVELRTDEFCVAGYAFELLKAGPHLPEDLLPSELLRPQEHDELVDVPVLVAHVLRDCLAVGIDEQLRLGAVLPLSLVAGVQVAAVDATVQHIVFLIVQLLEFLHEKLRLELVFLIV